MSKGNRPLRAVLGLALSAPGIALAGGGPLADCNADEPWRVLRAAAGDAVEARAYWLDRGLIQWPEQAGEGRYRLYHAADGGLVTRTGTRVRGSDAAVALVVDAAPLSPALATRFKFIGDGVRLAVPASGRFRVPELLRGQLRLVREDAQGRVVAATDLQAPGALDDLYAAATEIDDFGANPRSGATRFRVWAPTAQAVSVCLYDNDGDAAKAARALRRDDATGAWSLDLPADLSGRYYAYLVDVFVPGAGVVRNRVTDPYSVGLGADSRRSYIADLDSPALKPQGWDETPSPDTVRASTDMSIYELHVRDFSRDDASVAAANRGKYLAFTEAGSDGMRHLRALAQAGLTDVHLLPVFDFATVQERDCVVPEVPQAAADGDAQQAAVMKVAARDCFNWGYDPFHYSAPEGSYASDAADGAKRIVEFRAMVQALHRAGLRVGMDVVYNHTSASGQSPHSVLDRIVPGYYQRLDAAGRVETSTCCANTATEHAMMGKLMIDSVALWAKQYRIDSFRFDLMGHQPRAAMEALKRRVDAAAGRDVPLIGEGWNFGEIADGKRFVQASQLSLNGSGIGTFSDRARDALRGGGPSDSGEALFAEQGWLNGLVYAPNAHAPRERPREDLLRAADLVRVGLAGSIRDFPLVAFDGTPTVLEKIDYKGQPAGYASQPSEVVNYVENHDNQTLFDIGVFKLPAGTSGEDRARVQMLGAAINAFSQGVAYFHAGIDTLRSKSLDRNSYDSGDWFNRIDWTYADNHFGTGLPPRQDNGRDWESMRPLLADPSIRPSPRDIAFARDQFRDLLRIRASSTLFRLRSADEIKRRLRFPNSGAGQDPLVLAGHLDGSGYPGAGFREILYLVNAGTTERELVLPEERGKRYRLHPVQASRNAADPRPRETARYVANSGRFVVPARSAVVYVVE
ncbi:hypothetical protein GCM10027084_20090 [Pseudoxanthomonas sangjuensis]|uniref:alpha-1,6-glucosidase domain-containing protein n=1 Tax=Pseudoxanthomonas sangjuensis TaxID=1503750 RepID=UPI0013906F37|nr:alpha-1,6-glucosidase domain-containing protein [Pseudoxanthomonas sangjuensis]KAF1715343.1 alpha-1,6-glucosidase [Pseudoxanthomonas sangjuensis]